MKIEISVRVGGVSAEATLFMEQLVIWINRNGVSERVELTAEHAYSLAQIMIHDPIGTIIDMTKPKIYGKSHNGSGPCN